MRDLTAFSCVQAFNFLKKTQNINMEGDVSSLFELEVNALVSAGIQRSREQLHTVRAIE